MAITSAAGASLTKIHSVPVGSPFSVSFTSQCYNGWVRVPSLGVERTLIDHDNRLLVKLNVAGKLALWLDGVLAATGIVTQPINQWFYWALKKNTTSPNYLLRSCQLDCISGVPTLTSLVDDISHDQSVIAGDPTQFTLNIPAGCSICNFMYGPNGTNLGSIGRLNFGITTGGNVFKIRAPLRFPDDLYNLRSVSALSGDTTFHGMFGWSSQSGTITLSASGDPENLLNQTCLAVLGYLDLGFGLDTAHGPITPGQIVFNNSIPLNIPILTNVLPPTAFDLGIRIGGRCTRVDPGDEGDGFAFQDNYGFYRRTPDPTVYGPYQFNSQQYDVVYFDVSHWGAPNFANSPISPGVNPSTGLPWTLADVYASIFYASCRWLGGANNPISTCATERTFEAAIWATYKGQSIPATCGGGPTPSTGNIIVLKEVIDGT